MDKVVHFEIPFDKKARAMKFYSDVFGWGLNEIPSLKYVTVQTADTDSDRMVLDKGAINGGLFKRSKRAAVPIVVVMVDSIDRTIEKVKNVGGKLVSRKQPIPNGSYARIADSEGNVVGIIDRQKSE